MAVASAECGVRSAEWWKWRRCALLIVALVTLARCGVAQTQLRTPHSALHTPLFWAQGINRADQLDAYRATGLNTVVVRLTWPPSPDGALEPNDLAPQQAFARAAAARGLNIIYQLPAAPFGMERQLRMTAESDAYFTIWTFWVQAAIVALRDTPNLRGWMLPDDPRSLPFDDDLGFARWLAANYANIEVVNRQWNSDFPSFAQATIAAAQGLVQRWHGPDADISQLDDAALERRLEAANQRPDNANWTFHPAALALACYRWTAYRALLARWAQVVRGAAPDALILSGQLPDYAQLLSLPSNIDVAVPNIRPDNAETDVTTHNPQAVDIARRGGRFAAIPTLTTAGAIPPEALPQLIPAWANSALAHGASGLAFSSWPALQAQAPVRAAVQSTLERLCAPALARLWTQTPIATTAIVLTPLADGHTMPGALPGQGRGLYGFGEYMIAGEPNNLVYALRWGTLFGSMDYLAPDDLAALGPALGRYTTILLPQALSVSGAVASALEEYTRNGGVLVADLGLGAMQAEGRASALPPDLAALFGVVPQMQLRSLAFNLHLLTPFPLWPTWTNTTPRVGTFGRLQRNPPLSGGRGPRGVAFAGAVGFPVSILSALPGTVQVALAAQVPQQLGTPGAPMRLERAALTVHPHGRGFAIFAPFQLWTMWSPGQPGFDAFHGDLFARGAALAQGESSLVPAPPTATTMLYPETVNLPDGVLLLNHLAPLPTPLSASPSLTETRGNAVVPPGLATPDLATSGLTAPSSSPDAAEPSTAPAAPPPNSLYSTVQTMGAGQFLWNGGVCVFPLPGRTPPLTGARVAPVPDTGASHPQPVSLYTIVPPQELTRLAMIPARVENLAGGPISAYVATWKPDDAGFFLWPNSTAVLPTAGDLSVAVADAAPVRLTIYGGHDENGYRVPPFSRHVVRFTDKMKNNAQPARALVQADALGRLTINVTGAANYLEIAPAEKEATP